MNLYQATAYIKHRLCSRSTAGHGVHSPFIFSLLTTIMRNRSLDEAVRPVEELRKEMKKDRKVICVTDLGASPVRKTGNERRVSEIAGRSALSKVQVKLLARIVQGWFEDGAKVEAKVKAEVEAEVEAEAEAEVKAEVEVEEKSKNGSGSVRGNDEGVVLELGTSLGISTLGLALAAPGRKIITVEGCPELAAIAAQNLEKYGATNVEVLNMEFSEAIEAIKSRNVKVAFAYIDGNHRGEAMVKYVNSIAAMGEEMIIVADDIHLSPDMHNAWNTLTESNNAAATMETRRFGILFKRKSLTPGRYKIWC